MKIVIEGLFYHHAAKGRNAKKGNARKKASNNRTFPGLNDYIDYASQNRNYRSKIKREFQDIAGTFIRLQADRQIEGRVFIYYSFFERDKRRDPSNIAGFFIKVFEDALQECGIIDNDNWKITGYACYFYVDKEHPRVEVDIEELDRKKESE